MPSGIIAWATVPTDFLSGKTGMMWHTTGNLVRVTKEAKFPVGVAMLPAQATRAYRLRGANDYDPLRTFPLLTCGHESCSAEHIE